MMTLNELDMKYDLLIPKMYIFIHMIYMSTLNEIIPN